MALGRHVVHLELVILQPWSSFFFMPGGAFGNSRKDFLTDNQSVAAPLTFGACWQRRTEQNAVVKLKRQFICLGLEFGTNDISSPSSFFFFTFGHQLWRSSWLFTRKGEEVRTRGDTFVWHLNWDKCPRLFSCTTSEKDGRRRWPRSNAVKKFF